MQSTLLFDFCVCCSKWDTSKGEENQFLTRTNCTFSQHIVQNENFRYLLIDFEVIFGWEK